MINFVFWAIMTGLVSSLYYIGGWAAWGVGIAIVIVALLYGLVTIATRQ